MAALPTELGWRTLELIRALALVKQASNFVASLAQLLDALLDERRLGFDLLQFGDVLFDFRDRFDSS